jgi:hypothetical protein
MTRRRTLAAIAAAILLAGCGVPNPSAVTTSHPTPQRAPTGLRTPVIAQRDPLVRIAVDYTLTQATWSPDSYLAQKARLARMSTGRARAQLAVTGDQAPADVAAQLRAAHSSSRASLIGTDGPSAENDVVVAYKVLATGTGRMRGRTDYQLAHVALVSHDGAWLVSRFEIQP